MATADGGSAAPDAASSGGKAAVKVAFCPDPKTLGTKFTATYEKSPPQNFASLNAGDMKLFVGGSTMNGQFAKDLYNLGWQYPDKYQELHTRLLRSGKPGQLVKASSQVLAGDPNVCSAYVRVIAPEQRVGVAFVDIFKEEVRPHESKKNVAMIYTVGPQRRDCSSDGDFLSAVRAMAENVSAACCEYNAMKGKEEPSLEVVRISLVSGGAFAGKVPKAEVARAICQGIVDGNDPTIAPTFEFAFDGDVFRGAWQDI
eukprot:gnl/TRDRNA2_/TRDRNA2_196469_c0_seq1.p1 gnl/TRDRNA2_/TRDRNA2_196469_c0~~gnl/TRDRNA2_/TRDRNA2_196469_c0_seq1.p1  ORF type:complete len:257 (+),score=54.27 gnl/TRDRNA2_/TRDRNA2_196469_c0_seq1:82-852(+)